MYARGCRCEPCRQAEAAYKRERKAGTLAQTSRKLTVVAAGPADNTESLEPGRLAAAVAAEIEGLPAEKRNSALAALAMTLAHDLDRPEFGSSHARQSQELRAVLTELHSGARPAGKLALVSAMSPIGPRQSDPAG
jgi:hypothetical protein